MSNQTNLAPVTPPAEEGKARRGWFTSMRIQLVLAFALVTLAGVSLIGRYGYQKSKEYIHIGIEANYIHNIAISDQVVEGILHEIQGDLYVMANAPALKGLIRTRDGDGTDPLSGMSETSAVTYMQDFFVANAHAYGRYSQLRYLDENGNEVVRVNYDGTQARRVPVSELQNKADRYYFQEAMQLPAGQIYISPLDLNRENGQIQVPYLPTLRYAMPVFNERGERRGIVILNVMTQEIFHQPTIYWPEEKGAFLFVADSTGYYIHNSAHPETEFGGPNDLNTGQGLRADFPEIADRILSGQAGEIYTSDWEIFYSPIQVGEDSDKFIVLGLVMPRSIVNVSALQFSQTFIGVLAFSLILATVAGSFAARHITRPLVTLRDGVLQISTGNLEQKIQVSGSEEVQNLSYAFDQMRRELKRSFIEIERENDTRNALNTLLQLSLNDVPLDESMTQALDIILSIPWLAFGSSGAIFLAEDDQALVLISQRGLAEPIQRACARVPFGRCHCGRAAAEQKIKFADHLDVHHETTYEGIGPHGHYCVPILSGGKTLGVINVYLREGHRRDIQEEKFLLTIADTLAGSIERKRAEEALHSTEWRYRRLFEDAPVMYVTTRNEDGTPVITDYNKALCHNLGYSRDELLGKLLTDLYSPASRLEAIESGGYQRALEGRFGKHERELMSRDGSIIKTLAEAVPDIGPDGTAIGTWAMFMDITERKLVEDELRQRAAEREGLFKTSQSLVSTLDLATVLESITEQAASLLELETTALYLLEGENLYLGATTPPLPPQFPDSLRRARLADHPHIQEAVMTGLPVILPDAATSVLAEAERAVSEARGLRTILYVPLLVGEKRIGTLILGTVGKTRTFSPIQIELCRTFSNQAAIAIQNARLLEQVHQLNAELEQRVAARTDELQQSEERYRQLVDSSPDAIAVHSEGRIIFVNPAAVALIDAHHADELLGKPVLELVHPDCRAAIVERMRAGYEEGKPADLLEEKFLRVDGSAVDVDVMSTPIIYQGKPAMQLIARDITERKRTEARMKAQHATAHIVSSAINLEEAAPFLLQEVCEAIGWQVGELWQVDEGAETMHCTALWHKPDMSVEAFAARTREITFPPGEGLPGQVWVASRPVWVADVVEEANFFRIHQAREAGLHAAVAVPIHLDGKVVGVIEFFNRAVISPDKNLITAMTGIGALLGQFAERQRAEAGLLVAKAEAERANHAKSEFLSRMSHELRTPLTAILGFTQLLQMDELNPNQMSHLDQILKSGRHLLDLINEVLDIARIEAGKMNISLESVKLEDAVNEALALIHPLAEARQLSISQKIPSSTDIYVLADRQRFRQILLNLLSNAVKYNRQGGEINITASLNIEGNLRLSVRDTGAGLAPEKMARLFTPFDRLGAETADEVGTGLGLALSKGLIEAMGGHMGAKSTVDQGSVFWLELKLVTEKLEETIMAEIDANLTDASKTCSGLVLYVEDNLANVNLVEAIFTRMPELKLITAMQGSLALDMAKEHHPDLILLDLHLPDMHGEVVLQHLRNRTETKHIPVIIMSADATQSQIEHMLSVGANAYLTKPIDVIEFLKTVREMLAG